MMKANNYNDGSQWRPVSFIHNQEKQKQKVVSLLFIKFLNMKACTACS